MPTGENAAGRSAGSNKAPVASRVSAVVEDAVPIRILGKDAGAYPELQEIVQALYRQYKGESSISRGTSI